MHRKSLQRKVFKIALARLAKVVPLNFKVLRYHDSRVHHFMIINNSKVFFINTYNSRIRP